MNYIDLAQKICEEMLHYRVTNESFYEVYNIIFNKYGEKYIQDKFQILVKVVHFITVNGYDIDCIKPLSFKRFID